jgi:hypothetical protein
MLDWTPPPISARRAGRLLWLAIITVVLITALAGPAISVPPSAAGSDVTGDQAGRASQWIARPPLRQARAGLGVAKVGRQILAISGFEGDNLFDVVEARRVKGSGRWRDLAPLPTARANLATAEVGGLVYAIGGIEAVGVDEFIDSNVVETFNPRSGRWATSLSLPQPRSGPGAASLGGLLYVAGGFVLPDGVTNSVVVYDARQNAWRPVAPMPTVRERLRLVASGRYLYAIGGAAPERGCLVWSVSDHGRTLRPQVRQLGHHEPDGRVSSFALRGRDEGWKPARAGGRRRSREVRGRHLSPGSTHHRGL